MAKKTIVAGNVVSKLVGKAATETFKMCIQCGLCSALCPWGRVDEHPFNIRRLVRQVQVGMEGFETDDVLYACTTCNLCVTRCPRKVQISDMIRGCRRLLADTGFHPRPYRDMVFSIRTFGNPWSQTRQNRLFWANTMSIPLYDKATDYLLYTCCTNSYDINRQSTLVSIARLLKQADISFGIIGKAENCCGESVRKIGAEEEFDGLSKNNTQMFIERGVKKIITMSPHCHYTFRNEYADLPDQIEIIHYTEFLESLVHEGLLKPKTLTPLKVSYHDPCYLGRHCQIYDAPRNVLKNIEGIELVELTNIKKESLCCGGGGGGIWLGRENTKLANARVEDATKKGADVLVSACPYCVNMLEYSSTLLEHSIRVMDICELVAEAC